MTTISKVNGCRLVGVGTDPDIRWAVFFTLYTKNHLGGYESFVGKFIERFGLSNRFVQYAYHKGRRRVYLLIVLPAPESREEELKWWGTFMSVVRRSPEVGSIELSRANVSGLFSAHSFLLRYPSLFSYLVAQALSADTAPVIADFEAPRKESQQSLPKHTQYPTA